MTKRRKVTHPGTSGGVLNQAMADNPGFREYVSFEDDWPLPDDALSQIRGDFPGLESDKVRRLVRLHFLHSFDPAPAVVRQELGDVERAANDLRRKMRTVSGRTHGAMLDACLLDDSDPKSEYLGMSRQEVTLKADQFAGLLADIANSAAKALTVNRGAPLSPLLPLVHECAALLRQSGYTPNTKPNGELVRLVRLILRFAEAQEPKDLRRAIVSALAKNPVSYKDYPR